MFRAKQKKRKKRKANPARPHLRDVAQRQSAVGGDVAAEEAGRPLTGCEGFK